MCNCTIFTLIEIFTIAYIKSIYSKSYNTSSIHWFFLIIGFVVHWEKRRSYQTTLIWGSIGKYKKNSRCSHKTPSLSKSLHFFFFNFISIFMRFYSVTRCAKDPLFHFTHAAVYVRLCLCGYTTFSTQFIHLFGRATAKIAQHKIGFSLSCPSNSYNISKYTYIALRKVFVIFRIPYKFTYRLTMYALRAI